MCSVTVFSKIFIMIFLSGLVSGSGIPMWEYLSRGEKVNHLYNMFTKQVHDYCNNLSMPDCKKVLLLYGLSNLSKMEEDSLDKMDPYQRGATDIIWESMMKGSYKSPGSPTQHHDLYGSNIQNMETSSSGNNNLGSQEEASTHVHHYADGETNKFVMGPMVVRLLPNGNPVPGEKGIPHLKDEDAEEFKLMRSQSPPSLAELENKSPYHQPSVETSTLDDQHQHESQND